MSYILDALQRAEQERQRKNGSVPGLHTRALPVPLEARDDIKLIPSRRAVAGLALLVIGALAVAIALWPERLPTMSSPTPPSVNTASVASPSASIPAPTAPAPAAAPLPQRAVPDTKPSAQVKNAPKGIAAVANTPPLTPSPPASVAPALPAPTASVLPLLKDMPEDFRRQLPPLAISGVVYSENPAQRLLLVNGQVLSQGSRAAADLTLDEIQSTASNFTFRGTRFKLNH